MKKLILFFFLCCFSMYGQNTIEQVRVVKDDKQIDELFSKIGSNELKLDILDILSQPALQITYEKINDPYSSFGCLLYTSDAADE